jgi:hypothetical protein
MYVDLNPKRKNYALWPHILQTLYLERSNFFTLKKREENIMTIAGHDALIVDLGRAIITLTMGTQNYDKGCLVVSRLDSYPFKF